jgi:hypothetical protein
MLDLSEYRRERKFTLPGGVSVTCKPLRLRDMQFLRENALDTVTRAITGKDDVEAADAEVFGLPSATDDAAVRAHQTTLFIHELAKATITKWSGVCDGGKELPPTHGNIDEYFDYVPGAAEGFLMQYMAPYVAVDAEGNAFGSVPVGNGDQGPNDAEPAEKTG